MEADTRSAFARLPVCCLPVSTLHVGPCCEELLCSGIPPVPAQGHSMATEAPSGEEVAGAMPAFVLHTSWASFSLESSPEGWRNGCGPLLSVALGLLDLADETRLHVPPSMASRRSKHKAPATVRPVPSELPYSVRERRQSCHLAPLGASPPITHIIESAAAAVNLQSASSPKCAVVHPFLSLLLG
jgi:hypothetical protein